MKIVNILKTRGVSGLFLKAVSKVYPLKIANWAMYSDNLRGKRGLEIGGPSKIFSEKGSLPLYSIIESLDGCNFNSTTVWEGTIEEGMTYEFLGGKKGYQFISDTVDLQDILSKKYDFVLSSNVLEHIANPLKAVSEWIRVLGDNGILVLAVPHRDATFDHNRPISTFVHLLEDFNKDVYEDDLTHLQEILELHDLSLDPFSGDFESFKERSLNNYENRCLHHHVFDTELVIDIFNFLELQILSIDFDLSNNIIIMGRKIEAGKANNDAFMGNKAIYRQKSPYLTDRR